MICASRGMHQSDCAWRSVFGGGSPEGGACGDQTGGFGGEFVTAFVEALQVGDGLLEHFELAGNRIVLLTVKAAGADAFAQAIRNRHRHEGLDHVIKRARVAGAIGFHGGRFRPVP